MIYVENIRHQHTRIWRLHGPDRRPQRQHDLLSEHSIKYAEKGQNPYRVKRTEQAQKKKKRTARSHTACRLARSTGPGADESHGVCGESKLSLVLEILNLIILELTSIFFICFGKGVAFGSGGGYCCCIHCLRNAALADRQR